MGVAELRAEFEKQDALAFQRLLEGIDSPGGLVEARPALLKELVKLEQYAAAAKVQELVLIGPQELQAELAKLTDVQDAVAVRQCVALYPSASALSAARGQLIDQLAVLKEYGAAACVQKRVPEAPPAMGFTMLELHGRLFQEAHSDAR